MSLTDTQKKDLSVINEYQKEISEIYETYLSVVQPFIVQLEVIDANFPVEILNEIRSIFQHISKCYKYPNDKDIKKNIGKANSHLKRAILDCYKYTCLSYDDEYKCFLHQFRGVDLKGVNNGEFLGELTVSYDKAKSLLIDAKSTESLSDDVVVSFNAYNNAYNAYFEVHEILKNNNRYVHRARRSQYFQKAISFLGWAIALGTTIFFFIEITFII